MTDKMSENDKILSDLSREELDKLGFGCYGVVDILNTFYTLPTGERLALRLWAPKGYLDISEVSTTTSDDKTSDKHFIVAELRNPDRKWPSC